MLKNIVNYFAEQNVSVPKGALLKTLKLFSAQCFIIFKKNIHDIFCVIIPDFYSKNAFMLSQNGNFYCKSL